jgi:hypothetical protein
MATEITDLQRAYKALSGKRKAYTDLWAYYDGRQPMVYTSKRLKDIFKDLDATFNENWCSVVIDCATDRINLRGFTIAGGGEAGGKLTEIFQELQLGLEADDVHEAALVTGEAFLIAWKEDNEQLPQVYYNDPRLCHLFYDPENPRQKSFAAKWWVDEQLKTRLTLYYPDRLEYYITQGKTDAPASANAFKPMPDTPTADNPFGEIPIFHFRPERRTIKGDLANVVPLQNGINKLLSDMLVAAEYGAFKQRWVISNGDLTKLKNSPNEVWGVPAGDGIGQGSQVGQFDATDLVNYISAINSLAAAAAIISRTPKHYLFEQAGTPSGEALIAMEAPLNKRVQNHIDRFTITWREVAAFLLKLTGAGDVPLISIQPQFTKPETVQPQTEANIRKTNVDSGVPLATALRWEGKSQEEIDQLMADKSEERKASQASLAKALLDQQRQFDQGGQGGQQP